MKHVLYASGPVERFVEFLQLHSGFIDWAPLAFDRSVKLSEY